MGTGHTPVFVAASDRSLLVRLGHQIGSDTHEKVVHLVKMLESDPLDGVTNLHPAYCSVLVVFDPLVQDHELLERQILEKLASAAEARLPDPRTIEIPVRYGAEFGPDLEDVALQCGLTPDNVIELHTSATYTVQFFGFLPGFAYLSGLPDAIAVPRVSVPRRRVPAGTVGIAGSQTAVYPFDTPGGWRLIGRTELRMFDADRTPPAVLSVGDRVRFVAVPCH